MKFMTVKKDLVFVKIGLNEVCDTYNIVTSRILLDSNL